MYTPQLNTFLVVARTRSFNKAADKLYISPPAVVKQINVLEQKLHLTLFQRTHQGLVLTKSGESLYRDAEFIIQYSKDAVERARYAGTERGDVIRIATSPMAPAQTLTDVWKDIHKRCPSLKFQLVSHENTPEQVNEILSNLGKQVDLVVGYYDENYLRRWKCRALQRSVEPVCCAVSIYSVLAEKETLTVANLHGKDLLMIQRGWNRHLDALRDDLQQNHPSIRIRDFDLFRLDIFNRCQENDTAIIAFRQWRDIHPLIKVLPVEWEYTVPYGFLYPQTCTVGIRQFLDAQQAAFTEN